MERTREEVIERIAGYLLVIDLKMADYYNKSQITYQAAPKAEVLIGKKFAKVVHAGQGVHTFIDLSNGDILKAATYKAPAPNGVRGNIFAEDFGASVVNQFGANYLK
jgi:hypothetical protein